MARHDEPLIVKLDPALKLRLKMEAVRQGTDMSKMTRQALAEFLDRVEREQRGRRIVENLSGSAGTGMTTDEIMALTRGE